MKAPTSAQVRKARTDRGMNTQEAAAVIHYGYRAWMQWEGGTRAMHPALWELWHLKVKKGGGK